MSAGFEVRGFYCQHPSCTARADGLPCDYGKAKGLPVGWIQVTALGFGPGIGKGPTSAYRDVAVRHYCSVAHLPVELLPDESA